MNAKHYAWKKSPSHKDFPVYFIMGSQQFDFPSKKAQIQAFLRVLEEACEAGIDLFQFRDKDHTQLLPEEQWELAQQAQTICHQYHVPFIVNDDVDMAVRLHADGIHIGQGDQDAAQVRQAIGPDMILGVSAHAVDQVQQAIKDGADYVGCGPVFTTTSKANVRPAIGPDLFQQLQEVHPGFPVFAIGGIHTDNIDQVHAMNPDAICVISEITQADNIAKVVQTLKFPK